jgi:hypothetical protein
MNPHAFLRKYFFLFCCLLALTVTGYAQSTALNPVDRDSMQLAEQDLLALSYVMHTDSSDERRFTACKELIRGLVASLNRPHSFEYTFPNLEGVSIQYAPDSSFRIFTWELHVNRDEYRHYGALQRNTEKLTLTPLIDRGFNLRENPENAILSADNWLGYVIYRMVPGGTFNGQPYYLLFGFDRFGTWRRQKILDVLTFDAAGKPQFGLPVFETYTERGQPLPDRSRIILEYGAEGQVAMQYELATNRIVYENLILMPGSNEEGPVNMPDGSYHALEYQDGRWVEIDKVFNHVYDKAPRDPQRKQDDRDIVGRPKGGGGR